MPNSQLPAASSITKDQVLRGIVSSFPPGFPIYPDNKWYGLAKAWAESDFRIYQFYAYLQRELNPGTATINGLLPAWEFAFNDRSCSDVSGLTEAQRQTNVVASMGGGTSGNSLSEIDTMVTEAFAGILFENSKRVLPLRFNNSMTFGNICFNDTTTIYVTVTSQVTDELLQRIQCFIETIIPASARRFAIRAST